MPSLTIKNIPPELLEALKHRAAGHHRSLNREVIDLLARSVAARRIDPEEAIARIEALKACPDLKPVSDAFIRKAIRQGRP